MYIQPVQMCILSHHPFDDGLCISEPSTFKDGIDCIGTINFMSGILSWSH